MKPEDYVDHVKAQCEALVRAQFWPLAPDTNPDAWLANFEGDDRVIAAIILQQFVLFSERTCVALMRRAFFHLLQSVASHELDRTKRQKRMQEFLATAFFCPIEGETPNVTDSGPALCRMLRKAIRIPDDRFLRTRDAVDAVLHGAPVVFVDDFVGTGEQLYHTWCRPYRLLSPQSFEEVHATTPVDARLLVLGITDHGFERTLKLGIRPCVVHRITDEDSIKNIQSSPEHPIQNDLPQAIEDFLRRHSSNLRLESHMLTANSALYGFGELGLTIGFPDSVPDATLPIIWAPGTKTGWVPLKEQK